MKRRTRTLQMVISTVQDEICDAGLDIAETSSGFQLSLRIHSAFFKFLIGQRGQTKKRLEMETKTQVKNY